MEYSRLSNIVIEGIDYNDHPEYSDAYIDSADYDGKPMTEEQLEYLDEHHSDFAGKYLHG